MSSADGDGDGTMDFEEFSKLLSSSLNLEKMTNLRNISLSFEKELKSIFDDLDKEGSGSISHSQVLQVLKETKVVEGVDDEEVLEWLQRNDEDGNGKLDFEEFKTMMSKKFQRSEKEKEEKEQLEEIFGAIDTNRDGKISLEEFSKALQSLKVEASEEEIFFLFKEHSNEESFIDLNHFETMLHAFVQL